MKKGALICYSVYLTPRWSQVGLGAVLFKARSPWASHSFLGNSSFHICKMGSALGPSSTSPGGLAPACCSAKCLPFLCPLSRSNRTNLVAFSLLQRAASPVSTRRTSPCLHVASCFSFRPQLKPTSRGAALTAPHSLALACLSCLYQTTFDVSCYLNYQLQRGLDLPIHHCTQHLRQWLPHSRCSLKTCYVSRADALAVGMSLGLAFKTRTQSY